MNADELPPLDVSTASATPWPLFARWYADAQTTLLSEPCAMTLATVGSDGAPAARVVLLRGYDERGFVFYTNYDSRKGAELARDPRAALVFHWDPLKRQVRIEGIAGRVSAAESDTYFASRPRGHRLSALISPQSAVIADRGFLVERLQALERQFEGREEIPRPAHWGGYRVVPSSIEFWQGRANRLHDRIRYRRLPDGSWTCERLAP